MWGVRMWEYGEVHVGVHRGVRRVPLREAAQLLGVSKDAVRQRIRRGTIRSEKGEDGRVYVYVDASPDASQPQADHAGHAYPQAEGGRQHAHPGSPPLVEELRDQVGYLREQLRREQDAHAEARRIIAALTSRIPELTPPAQGEETSPASEPPTDRREYTVTPTPQPGRVGPQPPLEAAQEGAESPETPLERPEGEEAWVDATGSQEGTERPWWRRVFGG
jgi:hypothetical protein